MEAERVAPAGSWEALDRSGPPDTRHDQGPTRRDIDHLARANAQHGMPVRRHEEGEMGLRTQPPIGPEHVPWL